MGPPGEWLEDDLNCVTLNTVTMGDLPAQFGLVYHGLHYSSPGINKPVTKKVDQIIIPQKQKLGKWGGSGKKRRWISVRTGFGLGKMVLSIALGAASHAAKLWLVVTSEYTGAGF